MYQSGQFISQCVSQVITLSVWELSMSVILNGKLLANSIFWRGVEGGGVTVSELSLLK